MRRLVLIAAAVSCLVPIILTAQGAPSRPKPGQTAQKPDANLMTNQDVIKMVKAGLSEEIVIRAVRQATTVRFDLSSDGLIALKTAGVSESILSTMQDPSAPAQPAKAPDRAVAPSSEQPHPQPLSPILVALPGGTPIKVCVARTLSSDTAKPGESVDLEVVEDVIVGGHTVIKKGAVASGKLTVATRQLLTRGGKLEVSVQAVDAANGVSVPLRGAKSVDGGRGLVRGNEATMPVDTEFVATVEGDQSLTLVPPASTGYAGASRSNVPTGNRDATPSASDDPTVARDAGIYLDLGTDASSHNLVPLDPTVFSQGKTGNAVLAGLTYGIKKMSWKAVVRGRKANLRVQDRQPVFYFYFENKGSGLSNTGGLGGWLAGASSPNEFTLAKMDRTDSSRELIVGEFGLAGSSMGPRSEDTVDLKVERLAPGIFKVSPRTRLEAAGEYCLFYAAGAQMMGAGATGGKLFDFGVDAK
jgi:hypothetical protein